MNAVSRVSYASAAVLAGLASALPAAAEETEFPIDPDVVITFQRDLFSQPPHGVGQPAQAKALTMPDEGSVEAACIAVSLGRILVKSGQAATLFPSIAGVKLANETLLDETDLGAEECMNPFYHPDKNPTADPLVPLKEHLKLFVEEGGNILVCPLCWNSREYTEDDLIEVQVLSCPLDPGCAIAVGNSETVAPTFINAEKSIDF